MKFVLSFIIAVILFTSCTYYKPCSFQVTNTYPNNTVVIGNVSATAKIVYVLGLGKTDQLPITQQAKNNLLSKYKLKPYQTLTNITLDYTKTYWLFGFTDRAIINADVVQFLKLGETYVPNDSLFMIGTKEVNGKKVNIYSQRFNYKLWEEVKVIDFMSSAEPKIIELYDDEALVKYFSVTAELYQTVMKTIPYSKISKKQQ
jgi:hypothetical protein